jgi:outer membrane protein assembly factor BamB
MSGRIGLPVLIWLTAATPLYAPPPPPKLKEPTNPFLAWSVKDETGQNGFNHVAVINGLVVGGTDKGELVAIDAKTGKPVWKVAHGHRIYHTPTGDGERVYFTSKQGVTAVNTKQGSLDWSYPGAQCDGPVLVKAETGLVYVGGSDGNLYALDVGNGNLN